MCNIGIYSTHWHLHNRIKILLYSLSLLCLKVFHDFLFVILRKNFKFISWTLKTIEALICLILTSTYCLAAIGSSHTKLFIPFLLPFQYHWPSIRDESSLKLEYIFGYEIKGYKCKIIYILSLYVSICWKPTILLNLPNIISPVKCFLVHHSEWINTFSVFPLYSLSLHIFSTYQSSL